MPLSRNEINPLSVLESRNLPYIPEHFSKIVSFNDLNITLLSIWINYNLNSRYSIKKTVALDKNNKISEAVIIGIEDQKELLMLTLGCPHFLNNS